jgi:hypothetical protein
VDLLGVVFGAGRLTLHTRAAASLLALPGASLASSPACSTLAPT